MTIRLGELEIPGNMRKMAVRLLAVVAIVACLAAGPAHASTTFTVTSTGNRGDLIPGDGDCDAGGPFATRCTLRAVIEALKATTMNAPWCSLIAAISRFWTG